MARSRMKTRRVWWWAWVTVFGLIVALAPVPPGIVESVYSRRLFPTLQSGITSLSNLMPFALLDVLIGLAVILVIYRGIRLGATAVADGFAAAGLEWLKRVLRLAAVAAVVFLAFWGWNYRREPLETVVATVATPATADIQALVAEANALAVRIRPRGRLTTTYAEAAEALAAPMNAALVALGRPPLRVTGRPKHSLILTPYFGWAGVSGMINPFGLESIVDPNLLPVERPFVLAHEWAHLAGLADEAEASTVGWLACLKGDPALAYSASLYLIAEAAGTLPPGARRATLSALDQVVKDDLNEIAGRVVRVEKPIVRRAASRAYDQYLRANQVEDGAASYARAVQLILAPEIRAAIAAYRAPATAR